MGANGEWRIVELRALTSKSFSEPRGKHEGQTRARPAYRERLATHS